MSEETDYKKYQVYGVLEIHHERGSSLDMVSLTERLNGRSDPIHNIRRIAESISAVNRLVAVIVKRRDSIVFSKVDEENWMRADKGWNQAHLDS